MAAPALDAPVRRRLVRRDDAARFGAIEVVRSVTGLPAQPSPPAAKEGARPTYLRGARGTFDALLEDAIAESVVVVNAAGAVLDADDRDAAAALAALAALLPAGTIDPQGAALDLARPVAISLRRPDRGERDIGVVIGSPAPWVGLGSR